MKPYIIIIITLASSFFTGGCKKTLEEVPKNFISSDAFYKTAADAEAAVLGIYSAASSGNASARDQLLELHSDFAVGRGSWASVSFFDQLLDLVQIGRARDMLWNLNYLVIGRANEVLKKVPAVIMDETRKKSLLAEARFMRAMAYFDLVRAYGPVPLRITTVAVDNISAPRAPTADVYKFIIDELKLAETDLPASVGINTRRACKWAAKLGQAQVYLTLEQWSDAAAKADEIIAGGQYKLIPVIQPDDFYKIFAVNTSTEDIMSIHFASIAEDYYVLTFHLPSIPAYNNSSTGFFTTLPRTNSFIGASWNDADLRKAFNLYTQYRNNAGVIVPLPSSTPILFKKFIASASGIRSNSRPVLRYAEAFLIYAEAKTMADGTPSALALERVNMIKRRAYGKDFNIPAAIDYPAGMSKEQFRDTVIKERGYELMHEQRRWWDLKRIGKTKEFLEAATVRALMLIGYYSRYHRKN